MVEKMTCDGMSDSSWSQRDFDEMKNAKHVRLVHSYWPLFLVTFARGGG
jgi:hypothetical protein